MNVLHFLSIFIYFLVDVPNWPEYWAFFRKTRLPEGFMGEFTPSPHLLRSRGIRGIPSQPEDATGAG